MGSFRFVVSVMPKEGILDPQGRAVESALPHLDVRDVRDVRVGRRVELTVDASDASAARDVVERLAAELFANPLIESWSVDEVEDALIAGAAPVRIGVVVFPGSNCDRDALHAAALAGADALPLWHETPDLAGADIVVLPGGFAYGDYLRAGVIARFSPIMGAVREHAARGGLVLGICNGFQVIAEAGLVPGALLRNASLRFEHRWVRLSVERRDTAFTRAVPADRSLRMPIAHGEGCYYLPQDDLDALEARGGVLFRYTAPEGNPNGSVHDIAGVINATGNVCGLMPHPERAAESILGSDDGMLVLRSLLESGAATAAGATAARPVPELAGART